MSRFRGPARSIRPPVGGVPRATGGLIRPPAPVASLPPSLPSSQRSSLIEPDGINGSSFQVGDRVLIGGVKEGTIAFIGTTQFASGIWAGIVLDTPEGKNNGSVKNVSYFQCPPNHGLFAKPDKLTLVPKPRPQQPAAPPTEDFKVNDRVMVDGEKIGVVSFIGPTQFAKGIWVGVTLDQAEGKNDGSVNNVQYFSCPPNHGLFTRTNKLSLVSTTPTLSGHGTSSASSFSAGELKMKAEQLKIGDRVLVNGAKEGTLQYIGPTHFAKGIWVGVELNEPQGKNDGSVSGKRYFTCTDLHGLFAPLPKVEKIEETITPKVDNNSPNVIKRLSGRGLSGSPGSSVSSLSSLGRVRQMQQVEPEPLTPVRVEPLESETLSHIMFEKDHQIATLRSTVEQGEMDKAKLAEEITELRRKVDDLQFQLVEQSVISGDTLEQVSLKDQTQLSQALQQVNEEKQRNELMTRELDTCLKNIEQLEREKQELNDRLVQNAGSVGSTLLQERELEIKKLLIEKEQLLLEKTKAESSLKLAENDFKSTEIAAGGLQSELDTVKQQLQETLDVCGQQEALLEEKVNELENLEENSRSVARDLEALKMENMNLSETTNKLITERNAAIAQCDRLMAETSSSSNEQSQLAIQCRELLEERDQLRNSLQETTILLEKVNGERDDALYNLAEVKSLGAEADDKSKEMLIKYDSSQKELFELQSTLERCQRDYSTLAEELEQFKLNNDQKQQLSESAISEIKIRLDKSMKERDLALQEAQDISDKYENLKKERNQLVESCNEYQQHLEELQDQLEEVTQNYYSAAQDGNSELLQSQLDEANDKLEQKIRELHEMKEKVNGLEEQLYVDESQRGTGEVISALEREKLELQELVMELQNREEESSNDNATEEDRLLREALQAKEQENEFLNSVIVELKTKIETLEMLNGLGEQADVLKYASEDDLLGSGLPPPRLFCDICDEFDVHDTGDCPMQAQTESPLPSRHHGMRNNERPYCENCEVFGHWTDDCQYEETY